MVNFMTGFLKKYGSLDYAGGNVVHISSGVSGLVAAIERDTAKKDSSLITLS